MKKSAWTLCLERAHHHGERKRDAMRQPKYEIKHQHSINCRCHGRAVLPTQTTAANALLVDKVSLSRRLP